MSQKEIDRYKKELYEDPLYWASIFAEHLSGLCESPVYPNVQKQDEARVLFGLHLFPYRGATYGIPYGAADITSEFLKLPGVEDFGYWDNSDRPENISAREWTQRRKLWDKLYDTFYAADCSFQYEMFNYWRVVFPKLKESEVSDYLKDKRAEYVAKRTTELLRSKIEPEVKAANPDLDDNAIGLFFRVQDAAKKELKEKTKRASDAARQSEKDIPNNWDELTKLLPHKEEA